MTRIVGRLGKLIHDNRFCSILVLCGATAIALTAQTPVWAVNFRVLQSFNGTDGEFPYASLIQASDGNLYGTTLGGGANQPGGTIFKITPDGALTTLYNFCSENGCTDGFEPVAPLVQATDGELYGITTFGGAYNRGTLFEMIAKGTPTTLLSFGQGSGAYPYAALVQTANGNLYGTTRGGGFDGDGTVFGIMSNGMLKQLHTFAGADGRYPLAGLVRASDGNLYGTTSGGGANGGGTVFKINSNGMLTTLYNFCSQVSSEGICLDGAAPQAALILARNGNFYGTTLQGGAGNAGTIFQITSSGIVTTLYSFCSESGCLDGAFPLATLIQARNGNLYGTTSAGGANDTNSGGDGTVFEITLDAKLTTLYSFCSESNCADGENPQAGLAQAANGNLYGTATAGGIGYDGGFSGLGTVFEIVP